MQAAVPTELLWGHLPLDGRRFVSCVQGKIALPGKLRSTDLRLTQQKSAKTARSDLILLSLLCRRGAFDSAKNHKRQRRKRQSVTAKREKSQTPKFV